ncbi:aconitase/3-isopropylmalate dehydratase large subunit family protein [Amycolatopsis rhabdoformis]|uniref:Aconitase/3-isopropylmalate dehydratase large subunit family protein n=1 Tax=Amycolatopsis rhabdoformis TaxID=1448059 RepID=A0ABZ1IBV9_9PSEU|nr:aconitase/3-isopropylmalate dehydratase large subunit family protein [Amycolatopsis rhabdoformis]WSE31902.1 aconitase/3-isopropylmalate dehydratase large subunit family protein [Amycolatopsis rhabdoformis]
MGQTIAEKVFSRQNVAREPAYAGDVIDADLDGLMVITYQAIRAAFTRLGFKDGPPLVFDRDRVYLMNDHVQPGIKIEVAQAAYDSKLDAARLGIANFRDTEMGVGHQMMLDYGYVRPGELVVGNDSHTVCYGALNAASTGMGNTEVAYALAFGQLYFTVPESIKVTLRGAARPYPFGKDIILHLAGLYGDDFAQDKSLEFHGPLASAMDLSSRMTIADHAVEVGAKFGLFLADEKTRAFVGERTDRPYQPVEPDPDATYAREIELDTDTLDFQVAKPFRFDNVVPVGEVVGTRIDQARVGSCANGRYEDLAITARMLQGRKVAPGVKFYVSPASMSVYKECVRTGVIETLLDAGVQVQEPGCGICQSPQIVLNEEVCITSTTRNYRGRFGGATCSEAEIYLASPATVTAAAIAGEIVHPGELLDV